MRLGGHRRAAELRRDGAQLRGQTDESGHPVATAPRVKRGPWLLDGRSLRSSPTPGPRVKSEGGQARAMTSSGRGCRLAAAGAEGKEEIAPRPTPRAAVTVPRATPLAAVTVPWTAPLTGCTLASAD